MLTLLGRMVVVLSVLSMLFAVMFDCPREGIGLSELEVMTVSMPVAFPAEGSCRGTNGDVCFEEAGDVTCDLFPVPAGSAVK